MKLKNLDRKPTAYEVRHFAGERCELTVGGTTYVFRPWQARQLAEWIDELWPPTFKRSDLCSCLSFQPDPNITAVVCQTCGKPQHQ